MVKIICSLFLIYAYFIGFLSCIEDQLGEVAEYRGLKSFYNLKK